jgi:hypothetical protein
LGLPTSVIGATITTTTTAVVTTTATATTTTISTATTATTISAAAAAISAATTTAAAATRWATFFGFVDAQVTTLKVDTVHLFDGFAGLVVILERDESKSAWAVCLTVERDE